MGRFWSFSVACRRLIRRLFEANRRLNRLLTTAYQVAGGGYPVLLKRVIDMAQRFAAHSVLIEEKGSGTQLIQDLRHQKAGVRPIAILPEGDKVTRMSNQSAKIEGGQVILPEKARGLDDFKAEILAFPRGKFDDQVDSLSQFLTWQSERYLRVSRVTRVRDLV